jgi:hypothetical protein
VAFLGSVTFINTALSSIFSPAWHHFDWIWFIRLESFLLPLLKFDSFLVLLSVGQGKQKIPLNRKNSVQEKYLFTWFCWGWFLEYPAQKQPECYLENCEEGHLYIRSLGSDQPPVPTSLLGILLSQGLPPAIAEQFNSCLSPLPVLSLGHLLVWPRGPIKRFPK